MRVRIFAIYLLLLTSPFSHATEFSLSIQPILPEAQLQKIYQPLADYLSQRTGHTIKIKTYRSFSSYWRKIFKHEKKFDLVLDAAHFTGYRAKYQNFKVLAKLPDTVSFSIVSRGDHFTIDTEELISQRIATMPSPSIGAIRLEQLFSNPVNIPNYIWEEDTDAAVQSVLSGKADAAIIPTRMVSTYDNLNVIHVTEPVPHMALSASPDIPPDIIEMLQRALLNASSSAAGKKMLAKLKIEQFEATDASEYEPYEQLLKDVYGYTASSRQLNLTREQTLN